MDRRLGRGLSSLLTDAEPSGATSAVELRLIRANPYQPRRTFEPEGLEELRVSIQNHGVLQPILLRPAPGGYELVSGERRWRAARLAGLTTIPAVVRKGVTDDEMLELALVENVQRRDLDPLERARGFRALMDRLGLDQEGVAARVGLNRSTVANLLRLLDLPERIQRLVAQRKLSMGHARALLGVKDPEEQSALADEIVASELSVRVAEERARGTRETVPRPPAERPATAGSAGAPPWARELERRLSDALGTRVQVRPGDGERGQVVVDYFSHADLDRIVDRFAPRRQL